jgi:hypothetical protein
MTSTRFRPTVLGMAAAALTAMAGCDGSDPLGPVPPGASAHAAAAAAPAVATFSKDFNASESTETLLVWHGTMTLGSQTGALVSTINLMTPGTRAAGATLHATVRWVVTGDLEIEFETAGVVNFNTGLVRTNGRVVSGPYAGSQVHQQGQLVGLDASGFLRIHPAS